MQANYATAPPAMETESRIPKQGLGTRSNCDISNRNMKSLRSLHLYLGCLFAPLLIFFAVTGSWQLFNWHQSTKDKSYIAPPALAALSFIHKDAHIPGTPGREPTPLRYFMLAAGGGLVATSVIGIVMAYRFSQRPMVATVCLFAGIALPAALLWIYK
jgi:hypothetical protein